MRAIRPLSILFLFLLPSVFASAQVDDARVPAFKKDDSHRLRKNTVYLEALGNGIYYSLNYDRLVYNHDKVHGSVRVGYGFYPLFNFDDGLWGMEHIVPVELNAMYEVGKFMPEVGLGATLAYRHETQPIGFDSPTDFYYLYGFLRIGIRYQPKEGGWFYRIGFTPNFFRIDNDADQQGVFYFFPWGSAGIGLTF